MLYCTHRGMVAVPQAYTQWLACRAQSSPHAPSDSGRGLQNICSSLALIAFVAAARGQRRAVLVLCPRSMRCSRWGWCWCFTHKLCMLIFRLAQLQNPAILSLDVDTTCSSKRSSKRPVCGVGCGHVCHTFLSAAHHACSSFVLLHRCPHLCSSSRQVQIDWKPTSVAHLGCIPALHLHKRIDVNVPWSSHSLSSSTRTYREHGCNYSCSRIGGSRQLRHGALDPRGCQVQKQRRHSGPIHRQRICMIHLHQVGDAGFSNGLSCPIHELRLILDAEAPNSEPLRCLNTRRQGTAGGHHCQLKQLACTSNRPSPQPTSKSVSFADRADISNAALMHSSHVGLNGASLLASVMATFSAATAGEASSCGGDSAWPPALCSSTLLMPAWHSTAQQHCSGARAATAALTSSRVCQEHANWIFNRSSHRSANSQRHAHSDTHSVVRHGTARGLWIQSRYAVRGGMKEIVPMACG